MEWLIDCSSLLRMHDDNWDREPHGDDLDGCDWLFVRRFSMNCHGELSYISDSTVDV